MTHSEEFVIEGGHALHGEIKASGSKNAALPLLPACLLTDQPVTFSNVPNIGDVQITCEILEQLGASVTWHDPETVTIHAENIRTYITPREKAIKIRSSFLFAGPLLARLGQIQIPPRGAT